MVVKDRFHCTSQGGRSAEGANGFRFTWTPLVEATFWSGFCKVQTLSRHISGEVLQFYVRLSREGCQLIEIAWITVVIQDVISNILAHAWQTVSPNQGPLGIDKRFPHPRKTNICWGWCVLIRFCQVQVTSSINLSHWMSPGIFLLWDINLVDWRCPRLTVCEHSPK